MSALNLPVCSHFICSCVLVLLLLRISEIGHHQTHFKKPITHFNFITNILTKYKQAPTQPYPHTYPKTTDTNYNESHTYVTEDTKDTKDTNKEV